MKRRFPGLSGLGAAALVGSLGLGLGCQGSGSFAKLQETLTQIKDNQQTILARLDQLEQKGGAAGAPDRPQKPEPQGPRPGQPDPKETYKVAVGDAHFKGPEDAKITIVEWSDFQ